MMWQPRSSSVLHPIILTSSYSISKFLVQHYNIQLCHSTAEHIFVKPHRKYWQILKTKWSKKYQLTWVDFRKWRAPKTPEWLTYHLPVCGFNSNQPSIQQESTVINVGQRTKGKVYYITTFIYSYLSIFITKHGHRFVIDLTHFMYWREKHHEIFPAGGTYFKEGRKTFMKHTMLWDLKTNLPLKRFTLILI